MRLGVVLLLLGLVAAVVGTFSGCNSLFTWNGRHAVEVMPLGEGPTTRELVPWGGRRYTVSVQVVFDREGLPESEGMPVVHAKMPLVVQVKDRMGTTLAQAAGWLDPAERPNVLYGQAAPPSQRGPMPELLVERLVGPFASAGDQPLSVYVDLGADRVGEARIASRRLVIYDDRLPPSIRNSFVVAAVGALAFLAGVVLVAMGWWRRRARRKRIGIRTGDVV